MIYWGMNISENTQGLDVLGVRYYDQSIEARLVNGITTIAARGRYFSILPWSIRLYYERLISKNEIFSKKGLMTFLTRIEILIIATSIEDPSGKAGGALLGSNVYSAEMKALTSGKSIRLPDSESSRMLNTYYNPCKSIGLLNDGRGEDTTPIRLTRRGRRVADARQASIGDVRALDFLFDGGELTNEQVERSIGAFSLGSMSIESAEAEALREAFIQPWAASTPTMQSKVDERYHRFDGTLRWIREIASNDHASGNEILARNLDVCYKQQHTDPISMDWAEYEWRRRHHFALELMLNGVCGLLHDLDAANTSEIVGRAKRDLLRDPAALSDFWPNAHLVWESSARDGVDLAPTNFNADLSMLRRAAENDCASTKLLRGFGIIAAQSKQRNSLAKFAAASSGQSTSDLALQIVLSADETPFDKFFCSFIEHCVIAPHLQVTYRKMSAGQKCSLRFFLDGRRLRPTLNHNPAGFSNTRLDNTMSILFDIGVFRRGARGELITLVDA